MVTDVVYDRFGIDLQGNKSETEDDKARVNATVGIGNGDVGQVDEVYYGNVYAGELNTMSDIGIAYARVFMGRISRITAGSDGRIQEKHSMFMRMLYPSLHLIL